MKKPNRYQSLIADIFEKAYSKGKVVVPFSRERLISTAAKLDIPVPKNVGDILYSFRYRNPLPEGILKTRRRARNGSSREQGGRSKNFVWFRSTASLPTTT